MRLSAACLFIVLGLASACGSPAEAAPDPESLLSCSGSLKVSMVADHAGDTRETRSPEQMAKEYGAHVGGAFSGQREVVYRSPERVDISFTDGGGRVQAVLTYRLHDEMGWLPDSGVNCP